MVIKMEKFESKDVATCLVCKCGNKNIEIGRVQALKEKRGQLYLLCLKCGNSEVLTMAQYNEIFGIDGGVIAAK